MQDLADSVFWGAFSGLFFLRIAADKRVFSKYLGYASYSQMRLGVTLRCAVTLVFCALLFAYFNSRSTPGWQARAIDGFVGVIVSYLVLMLIPERVWQTDR